MLKVNTATVDARVKRFGHFLNIVTADNAAVAGVTLDADAKEFQTFLPLSGVLRLGLLVNASFQTQDTPAHQ